VTVVYSDRYHLDLGGHVYPTEKYHRLYETAIERGVIRAADVLPPSPASWEDLGLVHTADYLARIRDGTLSIAEIAQLELPWSPDVACCFRLMTGGTIAAARSALSQGGRAVSFHIGGGLHHGFPDHGEGFCLFNDIAVAIRVLRRDAPGTRVAVVDLDVHQGNGTAFIFRDDDAVFTCSLHQARNYPGVKPPGSIDVGLDDGAGDGEYLEALAHVLPKVVAHSPAVIFYLAGADPYREDQLGGLNLSFDGLRRRDRMVLSGAADAGVPVVVTLAGGYARRVEDTVAVHLATLEECVRAERGA
jgi:acetoin utilization deacetylase AcuC-like enzyme